MLDASAYPSSHREVVILTREQAARLAYRADAFIAQLNEDMRTLRTYGATPDQARAERAQRIAEWRAECLGEGGGAGEREPVDFAQPSGGEKHTSTVQRMRGSP